MPTVKDTTVNWRYLQRRNTRLAAIRTLLAAEIIVIEAKRDQYIELGFGRPEAYFELRSRLNDTIEQLAEANAAMQALNRLGK